MSELVYWPLGLLKMASCPDSRNDDHLGLTVVKIHWGAFFFLMTGYRLAKYTFPNLLNKLNPFSIYKHEHWFQKLKSNILTIFQSLDWWRSHILLKHPTLSIAHAAPNGYKILIDWAVWYKQLFTLCVLALTSFEKNNLKYTSNPLFVIS